MQGFAAGYFLWDTTVSVEHLEILGVSSLLHGLAALGVSMLGFRPFANYYGINFVLYELSTPFLNVHWFLDKFGMTGSTVQWVNGILLLASFFASRLVWGVYQSVHIYRDVYTAWRSQGVLSDACATVFADLQSGGVANIPLACRQLPTWLGLFYVGANTALTVLNVLWFWKMIAAVRKRFDGPKKGWKEERHHTALKAGTEGVLDEQDE